MLFIQTVLHGYLLQRAMNQAKIEEVAGDEEVSRAEAEERFIERDGEIERFERLAFDKGKTDEEMFRQCLLYLQEPSIAKQVQKYEAQHKNEDSCDDLEPRYLGINENGGLGLAGYNMDYYNWAEDDETADDPEQTRYYFPMVKVGVEMKYADPTLVQVLKSVRGMQPCEVQVNTERKNYQAPKKIQVLPSHQFV